MKKSKKALLWSVIPILGISGGVAGTIASATNQNSSTSINNVTTLNSVSSVAKTRSTNDVTSKLEITDQTYDVLVRNEEIGDYIKVEVNRNYEESIDLTYDWRVNKGNGWEEYIKYDSDENTSEVMVTIDEDVSSLRTWTFRCVITDNSSSEIVTSEDIKFTMLPWEGDNIYVSNEPESKQSVDGGQEVNLYVEAKFTDVLESNEIGYRWFEYDSENNKYTLIDGADKNTYTFTAPFVNKTQTKKYVCKFYLKNKTGIYLSESSQAIVTINKSDSQSEPAKTLETSSSVTSNQASVKSNFYPNNRVDGAWYEVDVKNTKSNEKLVYQWYYAGRDGKEHLIEGADSNKLTPKDRKSVV